MLTRRALLRLGLAAAVPVTGPAGATAPTRLAAAWDDDAGRHFVGLLALAGDTLKVVASLELPTRAHGLCIEPGGTLLAVARRPGDWLLRWSPTTGRPVWRWSEPERRYTGHVLRMPGGEHLYTAETELDSGQGRLVRRDARSLAALDDSPTHGIDPHQFLVDGDGSLLLANGGVPTRPETGRTKLDLAQMDPSLVRLDPRDGRLLGQWRLPDARLSLRHLARAADGRVGIALQAEHDEAEARAAAPLLAVFDGQALRCAETPRPLAGYGGDIAATGGAFCVSAPRAGGVARWSLDGRWDGYTALDEACALAALPGALWSGGRAQAASWSEAAPAVGHKLAAIRLDNHWIPWITS